MSAGLFLVGGLLIITLGCSIVPIARWITEALCD